MNPDFWRGKRVFLTGHTGFKGGWLGHWLTELGAEVHGYSLAPTTTPSFFEETRLEGRIACSIIGDIRDLGQLSVAMENAEPEVVFHLAAQPLVRASYGTPVETFATNVMGTVNVLEAARHTGSVRAIVNVTTDKCYRNEEWLWPYRENDKLGGYDPYAASKACAELAADAYRQSFFSDTNIFMASARAGNVIGGGDWATDRLLPDFLRALDCGKTLSIRSPAAVRPWQHVLEPLSGYLLLAEKLFAGGSQYAAPWNFGPDEADAKSVEWIVERLCEHIPNARWEIEDAVNPHEAGLLKLDSSKARARLNWSPRWNLEDALVRTVEWHQAWKRGQDMFDLTSRQIKNYIQL